MSTVTPSPPGAQTGRRVRNKQQLEQCCGGGCVPGPFVMSARGTPSTPEPGDVASSSSGLRSGLAVVGVTALCQAGLQMARSAGRDFVMFRFLVAALGGRHPVLQAPVMATRATPSAVVKGPA